MMEMNQRNLLRTISEAQFAFLECGMFLDTHPDDKHALEKFEMYRLRMEELVKQYEKMYGPLTLSADFGNDGFAWGNGPWPWEKEAN